MAAIAGESEELQQLATVDVDIDTVRSQLDDYKVCVCVGRGGVYGIVMCVYICKCGVYVCFCIKYNELF